jgi:hypothetical protein
LAPDAMDLQLLVNCVDIKNQYQPDQTPHSLRKKEPQERILTGSKRRQYE